MSTDHVDRSTAITNRIEGLELTPDGAGRVDPSGAVVSAIRPVEEAFAPAGAGHRALVPRRSHRRVGRWGTAARVLCGSTLIVLATAVWRAGWLDLLIGVVALPALATSLMSLRDRSAPPLRLGAAGHLVTIAHVAITASLVGEAAALFYGGMALVAALHGNGGCEITVLANWLRGRDDRVGCPLFAPFDALDRELATRRS